jgi:two-component system cell cycle response regulator
MIIDLDRFKVINDTYGHQVGDDVLREVAKLVQENIRAGDSAARYGGEELAVILPETTGSGAFIVAERIRHAVAARPFANPQRNSRTLPVRTTISTGIACFPSDADDSPALIMSADKALYRAKEEGRNRTIMYNTTTFSTHPLGNLSEEE